MIFMMLYQVARCLIAVGYGGIKRAQCSAELDSCISVFAWRLTSVSKAG
jgi:hypothetical protein